VAVYLHAFNPALAGDEWSVLAPGRFIPRTQSPIIIEKEDMWNKELAWMF
jgi:hypothetical protein